MEFSTSALILYSALAAVTLVTASTGAIFFRHQIRSRDQRNAVKEIERYFRKNGVSVTVRCTASADGRLTAMIESEPTKRLQRMDKIERALCEYLYNNHGIELDKIFWRSIEANIQQRSHKKSGSKSSQQADTTTDLSTLGPTQIRHLPKMEALETCWESFRAASDPGTLKQSP
jgi:hypothetical protein